MQNKNDVEQQNKTGIDNVLYGPETTKAMSNFTISDIKMPRAFLWALGEIKCACAQANNALDLLGAEQTDAIKQAANAIADGLYDEQFPVDVFQTGSGTSTNMNANEVIATLVELNTKGNVSIHPNDHVNMGQSSNDIIPSCIHISAAKLISDNLLPSLLHLRDTLDSKAKKHATTIKTGRTHLMDAMPLSFEQEISAWSSQINHAYQQLNNAFPSLLKLAIGGTAIGTGVNTHPEFSKKVTEYLSQQTQLHFQPADNYFHAISAQDTAVLVSGILKTTAISISKISNDLRWLSSGPINGLNEIQLVELQKGSSIMPGKVNPVIPEAVLMGCTQVIGNDATISLAGHSGNFQLNTMLPLIGHTLVQSIEILSQCARSLADKAIRDFSINYAKVEENLAKNPILATALNELIGYDKSAEIAKKAYAENRTVLDVAIEMTELSESTLKSRLDPSFLINNRKR
ncbi:class II fumarate hydratase [Thalassotalea castellviae]|uniref:fumarate hydratase n=1 Tax=Thalassotalea castellviae TaxID=3075612 RepID=A0ABU2ZWS7_9GAMM|nr:class II fumarate hydratase [Thalassotalea sp. W431]MDT0602000.1 class II fumarate hydratase [Thalassotalea sp. W431]